mmetsp:Transcript_22077/g.46029  ORF Transcript_22077/g.46029 Transcript_22077/m.46029 type:complete len:239 (-) Transcript_22077:205-921(-)
MNRPDSSGHKTSYLCYLRRRNWFVNCKHCKIITLTISCLIQVIHETALFRPFVTSFFIGFVTGHLDFQSQLFTRVGKLVDSKAKAFIRSQNNGLSAFEKCRLNCVGHESGIIGITENIRRQSETHLRTLISFHVNPGVGTIRLVKKVQSHHRRTVFIEVFVQTNVFFQVFQHGRIVVGENDMVVVVVVVLFFFLVLWLVMAKQVTGGQAHQTTSRPQFQNITTPGSIQNHRRIHGNPT